MAHDPIGDAVRNLFALQRIGNGLSADAQKLIRALFDDLAAQLARIDPAAPNAARYRRDRVEKVMGAVDDLTGETFTALKKELRSKLAVLGSQQAKHAAGQLELALANPLGSVAIDIRRGRIGQNLMKSIIDTDPIHGHKLADWFEGQKRGTIARVRQQIQLGMAQNEPIGDIVRRVRGRSNGRGGFTGGAMATTSREAEAIVRTSVTHIANVAHFETYKENADILTGYEYTATLDSRTTLICAALDGQTFAIDDESAPKPPQHPNCRSVITPVIDWEGLGIEPPVEGARASDGGQVKGSTKYEDWLKKQPVHVQNEILGPGRAELFRAGKVTLRDMVRSDNSIVRLDKLA